MNVESPCAASQGPRFTIDIDTGGTFTDCYVSDGGQVVMAKADTTPYDLSQGVLACLELAAKSLGMTRGQLLRRCEAVRLSSTVGTNTFINRNGAKVGLMVGARLAMQLDQLSPLLPLDHTLVTPVPETINDSNSPEVRAATRLLLERGARILVIALDGDYDLPARETAACRIIAEDYPRHYLGAVPVLPSHRVTPILDGVMRIHTAVLDAYVHPVMARFLYRVEDLLRAEGLAHPLQVGNANGGTSRVAKTTALRTWGSGPAGGVAGAAEMAVRLGLERVTAVDIGGTSADISVIVGGRWQEEVAPAIEGVTVALPTLKLHSAGVGCGSIVRVRDGQITVGPDSAGAQPGPAAFGLGGDNATVTDAACCLGFFDPARFLGGRRALDVAAARRVVAEKVAAPLGIAVEEAAARIHERAVTSIAASLVERLAGAGIDPGHCALFCTGGGGGILGHAVGLKAGFAEVYAFPVSPVFSAFGLSRLDVCHTYEGLSALADIEPMLESLKSTALRDMKSEGFDTGAVAIHVEAETGTGNGVVVERLGSDLTQVVARLRRRHEAVRVIRLKATAPGRYASLPQPAATARPEPLAVRQIVWATGAEPTPVFAWLALPANTEINGPAVLETDETTLLVPPGVLGAIGRFGELRIQLARTAASLAASSQTAGVQP